MWPYPKIAAHRGGGKLAPENTLAAMRCGLKYGFHGVEFDVMLSQDNIPILMHDPDFGRTVAGVGNVSNCTARELTAMDAGSWFGPNFAGERVPTYEQVFNFCMRNRIWMNVEIKPVPGFEEATGHVVAALTQQFLTQQSLIQQFFASETDAVAGNMMPLLSSFSLEALLAAQVAAPTIPRGYLVDVIPADWQEHIKQTGAIALHTNQKNLTKELAQAVKDAGLGLFCYTVNDPARAREILAWGVDAFCTDRIDIIGPDFL